MLLAVGAGQSADVLFVPLNFTHQWLTLNVNRTRLSGPETAEPEKDRDCSQGSRNGDLRPRGKEVDVQSGLISVDRKLDDDHADLISSVRYRIVSWSDCFCFYSSREK